MNYPSKAVIDLRAGASIVLVLLAMLYVLTAWATGSGIVDDAYIFLRYARNVWEGAGPVFNDGERVEGYTSPLWLAVLSALWPVLSANPGGMAVGASAFTGFISILLVGNYDRALSPQARTLGAVFLASSPSFVYWAWSGMDTAIFTALIGLALLVFEREMRLGQAPLKSGTIMAFAALTRLEALWFMPLLAIIVATARAPRLVSKMMSLCAPTVVLVGLHTLWRVSYYGAWLPNTFSAKVGVPSSVLARHGMSYLGSSLLHFAPLVVLLGMLIARLPTQLRRRLMLPLIAVGWWLVYVLVVGGDHFALFRFIVPALLIAGFLIARVADFTLPNLSSRRHVVVTGAAIVLANWVTLITPQAMEARREVWRAAGWARTGQWCAHTLPSGSVASLVIGAIPFYCDRETYDLLGLTDRTVALEGLTHPDAAVGHQKSAPDYILSRAPSYIFFSASGQVREPLFASPNTRAERLQRRTNQALIDLTTHPEALLRYHYRAVQLDDGTWIEFLERKQEGR